MYVESDRMAAALKMTCRNLKNMCRNTSEREMIGGPKFLLPQTISYTSRPGATKYRRKDERNSIGANPYKRLQFDEWALVQKKKTIREELVQQVRQYKYVSDSEVFMIFYPTSGLPKQRNVFSSFQTSTTRSPYLQKRFVGPYRSVHYDRTSAVCNEQTQSAKHNDVYKTAGIKTHGEMTRPCEKLKRLRDVNMSRRHKLHENDLFQSSQNF